MHETEGSRPPSIADRKRLVAISLFLFFLFSLLIIQFYRIQIVEGEKWANKAKAQHQIVVVESSKRGVFYSNTSLKMGHPDHPQPFVFDVPKFHLYIDPLSIPPSFHREIVVQLRKFFSLNEQECHKLFSQFGKKSHSRKAVMWINQNVRNQVQEWWASYARSKKIASNALYFVQDYKRSYPFGKLLGQVLHTVREDKDIHTHQSIPTGGLEFIFNKYLQGKEGRRFLLRSPSHPLDTGKVLTHPENGADVYLTINHYIQAIAEEGICTAVKRARAKGGWAVMMDPFTGEILALAQYPWFYPADYKTFFNRQEFLEHTRVKAICDPYEPGSTMKALNIAIYLKANLELKKQGKAPLFSPKEKVATATCYLPGRKKPMKDTSFHSYLNMYMALQKSSNIYVAKMMQRVIETLGAEWYRSALQQTFGFGLKTEIELPSESAGLLPAQGKKWPNGTLEWSSGTPYSLAMGHNILVNGMQMLQSYAIIANGGYAVKPTLVRKIVASNLDGSEKVLLDMAAEREKRGKKRVLEEEITEELIKGLKFVTKPGGSAQKGDIFGYTEVGKTGTSEKIVEGVYSKKNHISTFIGFAPVRNARFVLLIAIDEPEHGFIPGIGKNQMGGNCAAPAFQEIGERTLQYLGIEPDDPYGYPPQDSRYDPAKADWMKETRELRKLYSEWNAKK